MIWGVACARAWAGSWSEPAPYLTPTLNVALVWVEGDTSARTAVGLVGGTRVRYTRSPHWLSDTRFSVLGQYGIDSGSLGADVRVGSTFGPDTHGDVFGFTWQVGPEVWANGFGAPDATDGYLPWSPGVAIRNALVLEAGDHVAFLVEASPGWAFAASRRGGPLAPIDELDISAAADLHTRYVAFRIGYTRSYRWFGHQDALVLYGSL